MPKKLIKKIKDYWNSHKDVPLFKAKLFLIIMLIICLLMPKEQDRRHKNDEGSGEAEGTSAVGGVRDEKMGESAYNYVFSLPNDRGYEPCRTV